MCIRDRLLVEREHEPDVGLEVVGRPGVDGVVSGSAWRVHHEHVAHGSSPSGWCARGSVPGAFEEKSEPGAGSLHRAGSYASGSLVPTCRARALVIAFGSAAGAADGPRKG